MTKTNLNIKSTRGIARKAVSLLMAGVLAMGICLPISAAVNASSGVAYAAEGDETGENEITLALESPDGVMQGVEYSAIKLFDGKVANADAQNNNYPLYLDDIEYASEEVAAVLKAKYLECDSNSDYASSAFGKGNIYLETEFSAGDSCPVCEEGHLVETYVDENQSAQSVAENFTYKGAKFDSFMGMHKTPQTEYVAYIKALAEDLANNNVPSTTIVADEGAVSLPGEGYYLVVCKDELNTEGSSASAPIFVGINAPRVITLKADTPAATFKIDGEASADHFLKENATYTASFTCPENIWSYDSYPLSFHCDWDENKISLSEDAISVILESGLSGESSTDVSDFANIETKDGNLVVSFDDILAVYKNKYAQNRWGNSIGSITLTYKAYQSGNTASPDGANSTLYCEYANNPTVPASTGKTQVTTVADYSYKITIKTVDKGTNENVAGAKYTVRVGKNATTNTSCLMYKNGEFSVGPMGNSLTDTFKSNNDGEIVLDGVKAQAYTVVAYDVPTGYAKSDNSGSLSFDLADRNILKTSFTSNTDLFTNDTAEGAKEVLLTSKLIKHVYLPSTGQLGLSFTVALAAAAAIAAITRRKKDEEAQIMYV